MEKPVERIHPPFLDEIERRSACHDMFKHYFEDKPKQTNMEKQNEEEKGLTKADLSHDLLRIANDLLAKVEELEAERTLSPTGKRTISFFPAKGCFFTNIQADKDKISLSVEKKAPKRADDLSGLKVGDKVWSIIDGWGIVTRRLKGGFPIEVAFNTGITATFYNNGLSNIDNIGQSLFLTEIKYEIPTID